MNDSHDEITMRRAVPEDSEFAFSVKKAAFRKYIEMVWGWNDAEQRAMHERRFAEPEFWIVSVANIDIGILALARKIDRIEANQLFLLPDYQRQGIGHYCMQRILVESKEKDLPVHIQTLKVNIPAQNFALKLGFRKVSETTTHVQWKWSE